MNGHILSGTNIAVDYWTIKGRCENSIHFLTHLHGDHIVGLTSSWQRPIYCSEFTSELLIKKYGLSQSLLRVCPLEQAILVTECTSRSFAVTECTSRSFAVTAYDADHCPGAVMFYFEGDFGNIFYTGDFRSSPQVIEGCRHLINKIDTLYVDNTFCSPNCVFPSRDECFISIIDIIRRHPQHDIVIGVKKLGKELLLAKLGTALGETISVSPACFQICQLLFTTDVFTTVALNNGKPRIQTVPAHLISRKFVENLNKTKQTIAILPTAIFTGLGCQPFCREPNIFVVPYSDHCNFQELFEFVSTLKPGKVLPIVRHFRGPFGISLSDREDMSCFQSVLSQDMSERTIQRCLYTHGNKMPSLYHLSELGNDKLGSQSVLTARSNNMRCSKFTSLLPVTARSNNMRCSKFTSLLPVTARSNNMRCSKFTSLLPVEGPSGLQPLWHRQKRRKNMRNVPINSRKLARGVIYTNPVSDIRGICVNSVSDIRGICVNSVSDNRGICVNSVSDMKLTDCSDTKLTDCSDTKLTDCSDTKLTDCSDTVKDSTERDYRGTRKRQDKNTLAGVEHNIDYKADDSNDDDIECMDSPEACDGKVKQLTRIDYGGSLEQSVDSSDDSSNRVSKLKRTRMLSDQSIVDGNSSIARNPSKALRMLSDQSIVDGNISIARNPSKALRTKFTPKDLCASSGLLLMPRRLEWPQNNQKTLTNDLIAALLNFVKKTAS